MISLAIIFGLFFTVFATQNTQTVNLVFGELTVPQIPLYIVILGSLLLGVIISWIFNLFDNISAFFILNRKEKTLRELKKTIAELVRRVHQLEIESESKTGKKNKSENSEDENSL